MQLGDPTFTFFTILILVFSIIIHEVSHGYAAYALGDPTAKLAGRLTLNPFSHVDLMGSIVIPAVLVLTNAGVLFGWAKPVPYNPYNLKNQRWGEAIVAFAGGGANLLIALIFALFVRVASAAPAIPATFTALAAAIVFANLFLGLFNLLPLPPLDGWTVLRGVLPYRMSYALREFDARVRGWGPLGLVAVLVVFIALFSAPFFTFVSWLFALLVGG